MYVIIGPEQDLTFHDGTVRDIVFMQDISNRASLLISAGAGDSKIYVSDCETAMPVSAMAGHTGRIQVIFLNFPKLLNICSIYF